jgi:hypothetical protein
MFIINRIRPADCAVEPASQREHRLPQQRILSLYCDKVLCEPFFEEQLNTNGAGAVHA